MLITALLAQAEIQGQSTLLNPTPTEGQPIRENTPRGVGHKVKIIFNTGGQVVSGVRKTFKSAESSLSCLHGVGKKFQEQQTYLRQAKELVEKLNMAKGGKELRSACQALEKFVGNDVNKGLGLFSWAQSFFTTQPVLSEKAEQVVALVKSIETNGEENVLSLMGQNDFLSLEGIRRLTENTQKLLDGEMSGQQIADLALSLSEELGIKSTLEQTFNTIQKTEENILENESVKTLLESSKAVTFETDLFGKSYDQFDGANDVIAAGKAVCLLYEGLTGGSKVGDNNQRSRILTATKLARTAVSSKIVREGFKYAVGSSGAAPLAIAMNAASVSENVFNIYNAIHNDGLTLETGKKVAWEAAKAGEACLLRDNIFYQLAKFSGTTGLNVAKATWDILSSPL